MTSLAAALVGMALVLGACALFVRGRVVLVLLVTWLVLVLAVLAFGVQSGGLAGIDASVETWFDTHRSSRMQRTAVGIFDFVGRPSNVAIAAAVCGTLLSLWVRSALPAVLVIGAVVAAVAVEQMLKAVVGRSFPAEPQYSVLVHFQHSFPSGHVAGSAALLGMIAVCLGAGLASGPGRVRYAVLAVVVAVAVVVVAVTALYVRAHTFSDVVGGMVLGGACVTVGAIVLRSFPPAGPRQRRSPRPAAVARSGAGTGKAR